MTQPNINQLLQDLANSQTALASAAFASSRAYLALANAGVHVPLDLLGQIGPVPATPILTVTTKPEQATQTAPEAPKPARTSARKSAPAAPAPRRSSRRITEVPGTLTRDDLKAGVAVVVDGKEGKFVRLWRGTKGAFSAVDFGDGEHTKVETAKLHKPGSAPAVESAPGTSGPAIAPETPTEPTTDLVIGTDDGSWEPAKTDAEVLADLAKAAEASVAAAKAAEAPPPAKPALKVQQGGKNANGATDEQITKVYRGLLQLQPSKDNPVSAKAVSDKTGVPAGEVFKVFVSLLKTKNAQGQTAIGMDGKSQVVLVNPVPELAPKRSVVAKAQALQADLEAGGE